MNRTAELVTKVNEILIYIKNNNNYLDSIDDTFSEFKSKYNNIFEMIKNKQFDGKIFLGMIDILNRVDNKQITKYQGDMEFGSLIAKKYNIPMNFSDKDLKEISKKYNIPIDELKKHYSNLKK